ncbi:restriction endonuclease subunit S [Oryzobacter terrae]|uniref:restriction endonuclease subunit S n=1 Tax=Oryzobacter terrae TaxID=1620385 RepID=UPI003672B81F
MKTARVGDLAEQLRGVTFSKFDAAPSPRAGYVPVLTAGNIQDGRLITSTLTYVPSSKVGAKQLVRENDVVICTSSGSLGVVGKAARSDGSFSGGFGAFLKVLRPGPEVDPRYFAHYFQTPSYRRIISSQAAGANINNLKNEHLNNLDIPLPPLPEQRRIAAILDHADALRAKRRRVLAQLNSLTQSMFHHTFGSESRVDFGTLMADGPKNGLYRPASDYGSGTPIVRIDSFKFGSSVIHVDSLRRLRASPAQVQEFGLQVGDLLVNRVNSREHVGKTALVGPLQEATVFESNMMRIRVDRDLVLPVFVAEFMQTKDVRAQVKPMTKDAVNQSSINQTDVRSIQVPLPSLDVQRVFAARVALIDSQGDLIRRALVADETLFASLQVRAFRGEL